MAMSMDEYLSSLGMRGMRNYTSDMLKFLCLEPLKNPVISERLEH